MLCGDCKAMLDRAGTLILDSARPWITAAALGMPRALMGKDFLRGYAETRAVGTVPAMDGGNLERWAYVSDADRRVCWEQWPQAAPPEWRARRERIASMAAAIHATPARLNSASASTRRRSGDQLRQADLARVCG